MPRDYKQRGGNLYHRTIYEEYNQCTLLENTIVHHIDGNKINNIPENLELMLWGEHTSLHNIGKQRYGKRPYSNFNGKNRNPWTRVWQCRVKYNSQLIYLGTFEDFISCEIVGKMVWEELNEM